MTFALGTVGLGLAVYLGVVPLSGSAKDVAGDALWAMMIFWWVGAAIPVVRPGPRAVVAVAVCWAVELSQLYHGPTIDAWRATTLGRLALGSGFDPRDLVSYLAGVFGAVAAEWTLARRNGSVVER